LVKKLRGVAEPNARVALFAEIAQSAAADEVVASFEALGRAALARDPVASELVLSLLTPVAVFGEQERCQELIAAAQAGEQVVALQWLWAANEAHHVSGKKPSAETQSMVDRSLAQLTLGDRRALARRAGLDQLQRLAGDPDPMVVRHVLNNRRATESLVMTMCSKRPTVSAALETVIAAPTWVRRLAVRIALAHNPYLAVHAAAPLLVTLPHASLVAIRDDEALGGRLRLAASRLLQASAIPLEATALS
jgi:hypothetical protein